MFPLTIFGKGYISYHQKIIQIESTFLKEDFKTALVNFDKLFKEFDFIFSRDILCALKVSILANDREHIEKYSFMLIENGVDSSFIYSNPKLDSILSRYHIKQAVRLNFTKLHSIYLSKFDTNLARKLSSLYMNDIAAWDAHNKLHSKETGRNREIVGRENFYEYFSIIQSMKKFIGEKTIGSANIFSILNKQEYHRINGVNYLNPNFSTVLLPLHHFDCGIEKLFPYLMNAIEDGEIYPSDFAFYYEFSMNKNVISSCKMIYDKKYSVALLGKADTTFVNKCRSEIGMCTLSHDDSIKRFNKKFHVDFNEFK